MTVERRILGGVVACGRACISLSLLFAAPEAATAASAPPEIGEADLVVSLVRGRLGDSTRELAIKDNVYSEEVIETDADAATRIVFVDGTELSMGPLSRMVLDRYVYDPNTGTGEMAMRMVTGVFQFASGNIPAAGYDLGTPFGNLAIRGTVCDWVLDPGRGGTFHCDDPGDGVSIAGRTITSAANCLHVPVPGTGAPVFLDAAECEEERAPVTAALALLGLVEPAAGPVSPEFGVSQGPGAGDDPEPPGFGAGGTSPQ
jgi:hypothetical protein